MHTFNRILRALLYVVLGAIFVGGLYGGSQTLCCQLDVGLLRDQLLLAELVHTTLATIVGRDKFKGALAARLLMTAVLAIVLAIIWALAYWALRVVGLDQAVAAILAYLLSLVNAGITASVKSEEARAPEAPSKPARRRRR